MARRCWCPTWRTITVGNEPRLGVAGQDNDDDIVQGIVLMRRGAETLPTLRAVEKEVERINRSDLLPPGGAHRTHL